MGSNNSQSEYQYQFLRRPPNLPQYPTQRQLLSVAKPDKQYELIEGLNGRLFRYYKRIIQKQQQQSQIYNWRNLTNKPIVKVMHIQIMQISSQQKLAIGVYTQHLVKNLSEIKKLSIAQTIYLLKKSLSGYQEIFNFLGYGIVQPKYAGINEKGQCIIWISDNFSVNSISNSSFKNQPQVIFEIIKLIELTSSKQCKIFFQSLYKYLNSLFKPTFKSVQDFISTYCNKFQISIPLFLKYEKQEGKYYQQSKLLRFSNNKSQEFMSFRKKSIINISANRSFHNQAKSSHKKTISNQRSSIVDRILYFDKINHLNSDKQKNQNKQIDKYLHPNYNFSSKSTTVTKIQSKASDLEQTSTKNNRIGQGISPISKRYSLNSPKMAQLSSLNALLLQINEKDQQISLESCSERDHIIQQNSLKSIFPLKRLQYSQKRQKKNYIHICHQFSINIINQKIPSYYRGNTKQSSNIHKSPQTSQIYNYQESNNNSESINKSIFLGQQNIRARIQRFRSQASDQLYEVTNKKKKQDFKNKESNNIFIEVESATIFQKALSDDNKQNQYTMSMRHSKQPIKKRRNKLCLDSPERKQQENYKIAIKEIQENVIQSNNWKKIVNKLLSSQKQMELKHSMSYEFDQENTRSPLLDIKLQKLDRVGRHTNSIIPK